MCGIMLTVLLDANKLGKQEACFAYAGNKLGGDLGEIVALGAEIAP